MDDLPSINPDVDPSVGSASPHSHISEGTGHLGQPENEEVSVEHENPDRIGVDEFYEVNLSNTSIATEDTQIARLDQDQKQQDLERPKVRTSNIDTVGHDYERFESPYRSSTLDFGTMRAHHPSAVRRVVFLREGGGTLKRRAAAAQRSPFEST